MRDDFQSPDWAEHHGQLSAALHKAFDSVFHGLERLNAYQFDAPWRTKPQAKTSIKH